VSYDAERVSRLKAILDPGMRAAKMVELLRGEPEGVVIFLHDLLRRSGGPTDPNADVLDSLVVALGGDRIDYTVRSVLYATALARRDTVLARLFLEGRRKKAETAEIEKKLRDARAVEPRGRPLTLGERKSLARGKRDDKLLHLIRDPHPDVVAILLGNPHLIEADVLTIASRRPTLAATQEHVFASQRWRPRYRVKRALVLNPYSPPAIGIRLAVCLGNRDLAEISRDTKLVTEVRTHAAALLELRTSP